MKIKWCKELFKKERALNACYICCMCDDEKGIDDCLGILYLPWIIWSKIKKVTKSIIEKIKTKIYFIVKGWDDIPF